MTKTQDQLDRERNDEQHDYIERTFIGDNLFVGLATDPPLGQAPTKSAELYGKRRDQAMRARRLAEAKETISTAAVLDADRRAYELAMDQVQAGDPVTAADLEAAARHARRNKLVPPRTSAQKIADDAA